LTGGFFINI